MSTESAIDKATEKIEAATKSLEKKPNAIAVWYFTPIGSMISMIPFYVFWHWFNIKKFFHFVPEMYTEMGYWEMVGLATIIFYLKRVLAPLVYHKRALL